MPAMNEDNKSSVMLLMAIVIKIMLKLMRPTFHRVFLLCSLHALFSILSGIHLNWAEKNRNCKWVMFTRIKHHVASLRETPTKSAPDCSLFCQLTRGGVSMANSFRRVKYLDQKITQTERTEREIERERSGIC